MSEDTELSFEAAVARAGDEWSHDPDLRDRATLALRLYLHELLGTRSLQYGETRFCTTWYVTLAMQAARAWGARTGCHVLFLSLNYDTLLEQALGLSNCDNVEDFGPYIDGSDWSVVKPHGSVDWFVDLDHLGRMPSPFDRVSEIETAEGPLRWFGLNSLGVIEANAPRRPALSLPHGSGKPVLQAPDGHLNHLACNLANTAAS